MRDVILPDDARIRKIIIRSRLVPVVRDRICILILAFLSPSGERRDVSLRCSIRGQRELVERAGDINHRFMRRWEVLCYFRLSPGM